MQQERKTAADFVSLQPCSPPFSLQTWCSNVSSLWMWYFQLLPGAVCEGGHREDTVWSFLIQDLKKTQGCLLSYQPVISFRVSLALYFFHLLAGTHFALQLPILIPCLFSPNSLLPPEMGMFQAAAELQAIWFPYPHSSAPCHRRHSGRAVSHTPLPVTM